MLRKKLISAALSLGMVTAMLVAPTVKAESVNVAQGKKLYNADGTECTTMGNLVDGNTSTNTHDANVTEVIVDLGKRYKIDRISRNQLCGSQMVGIYVSNDINGEWKQVQKGNFGSAVVEATNINGAYRYVKLTAEGQWAHICTRELYVYAEETNGPALLDASQESGVVTLDFNDTLAPGTIGGITVEDAFGNPLSADMSLSSDKYSVTFNVPANKDWQVTIPSTVTTESGTPFTATTINVAPKDVYAGLDHKTVSGFNIAKGAKLYNTDGTECTNMGNLVDGNTSTNTDAAKCKEVIVDLGRRCKIDKISRNQLCGYQLVGIYVSNDINGEWIQLKYGNFQDNAVEVENVDGLYRYVKLTASDHICTSELYVNTTMDVTEVSRNKTTKASSAWGAYPSSAAVDGNNDTTWISEKGGYSWMQVDFEEAQHIGYIEVKGRNSSDYDSVAENNFSLYGSNADAAEITDTSSATVTGATSLATVASGVPKYNAENIDGSTYKKVVDDTNAYRYLIYKKNRAWDSRVGELTAYVINPRVLSMTMDENNVVTATFDSSIVPASVDGNISATSGDADVTISDVNVNDNVVTFTVVEPPAGDLTVTLNRLVRNNKSIPLAEDYSSVFTIEAPEVEAITVSDFAFSGTSAAGENVSVSSTVTNTFADGKEVIMYIAVKDNQKRLKAIDFDTKTVTKGTPQTLTKSIVLPAEFTSEWSIEAFVWEKTTLVPCVSKLTKSN